MMVSIDRAGRIVIPKEIRDQLELAPDTQLEIEAGPNGIHLRVRPERSRKVVLSSDGLPVIEAGEGPRSTDADVQRWRDGDQR